MQGDRQMVEDMAAAMWNRLHDQDGRRWNNDSLRGAGPSSVERGNYRAMARAAIDAIPGLRDLAEGRAAILPRLLTEEQDLLFEDSDGPCGPLVGCCQVGAPEAQEVLDQLISVTPYAPAKENGDG